MPLTISIINHKGGTGKTTTTVNLGRSLVLMGYEVLLIDLDPQGNLTYSLAINGFDYGIKEVLNEEANYSEALVSREGMDIIPTDITLAHLDIASNSFNPYSLAKICNAIDNYDFILIDCPPSLTMLSINALVASQQIIIPIQLDVFSIQGLKLIVDSVQDIKDEYNSDLQIMGILPVMVDKRKKLTEEVLQHIREEFDLYVFSNAVRTNVKAAEAPSFGTSVMTYAPQSNSAKDYRKVAKEFVEQLERELTTSN